MTNDDTRRMRRRRELAERYAERARRIFATESVADVSSELNAAEWCEFVNAVGAVDDNDDVFGLVRPVDDTDYTLTTDELRHWN